MRCHRQAHEAGRTLAAMTTENKSIVGRALAGLVDTGDVDTLASYLSEDFTHHRPPPLPQPARADGPGVA